MRRFRLLILLSSWLVSPAQAEDIYWTQVLINPAFNNQWSAFIEFQPRWTERMADTQLVIFRGAALYRFSPEWRVGLGYGMMPQYIPIARNESRVFQQLEWNPKLTEHWLPASRTRLEQRWLENAPDMSWRVREKLQMSWHPAKWGAYVWNELFWNLNGATGHIASGFDQNRFSIGPRYFEPPIMIEAGYLLQTIRGANEITSWNAGVVISLSVIL